MVNGNKEANLLCADLLTNNYNKMLFGSEYMDFLNLPRFSQQKYTSSIEDQCVFIHNCPKMEKCNNMDEYSPEISGSEMFLMSIDKDCKRYLAKYLSTGNLNELNFRREYVHEYLCIAEKLGLKDVKSYCEDKLKSELIPHDSLEMLQLARAYGMKQLQELCLRLIEIHFPKLWETPEFQYLGKNDLISLLQNPVISGLPCASDAIKHWYDYERDLRLEGYEKMQNMLNSVGVDAKNKNWSNNSNDVEYVIMFTSSKYDSETPRAVVMRMDTWKTELIKLGKIGHCGTGFAVCSQQRDVSEAPYIYVSGGKEKSATRVFKCDVIMNKWKEFAHLKHGRSQHCMANVEENLYVLGGLQATENKNEYTVEECRDGKHFRVVGNLCEGVRSSACAVYKSKIYLFGGVLDNGEHSTSIQSFDPLTHKTRKIGNLPCRAVGGSAVVVGDKIYINAESGEMVIFDPENGNTKLCAGHPHRTRNFGLFGDDCNIYTAGGIDEHGKAINDIYKYSIFEDKWEDSKTVLPSHMPIYGSCKIKMQRDLAMIPLLD